MKKILLIAFLFFTAALYSMDWPSPTGVMARNFGWNDEGRPCLGVTFLDEGELFAAEKGDLLFYRGENDSASRLPSPLGSWIALDHNDGIISIYSRFDDSSSGAASGMVPGTVEKTELLGKSGVSGWAARNGFYFQLYDRKERRWINPSMIISSREGLMEDTRPPVITSVRLRDDQGRSFDPSQIRNLSQGRYHVLVDSVDYMPLPNTQPLAPYRIICSLNGSEAGVLNFETYSARNGTLMVYRNGLVPVKQVYAPFPFYETAEVWLSRGQTTLEIISQDIAGNERRIVYRLMVE